MPRNKLFLLLSGAVVLLIVLVLVLVLFLGGDDAPANNGDSPIFGDTSDERPFDFETDPEGYASGSSSAPVLHGESLPVLRLLTSTPVSAVTTTLIRGEVANEPHARFIERTTGHILDANLARTTPPVPLSVVTVPRIQHAAWSANASTTAIQYLGQEATTIATFMGTLTKSEQPESEEKDGPSHYLDGDFLAEDIFSIAFSPTKNEVFYMVTTEAGSAGYVESLDTGSRTQVWDSPLKELISTWDAAEYILVSTKPSTDATGWVWRVNATTGRTELLLTEVLAVTTQANSTGSKVLFSTLEKTLASLRVLTVATGHIAHLPLITLPEKCTWSSFDVEVLYCAIPFSIPREREFPEGWYQGKVTWRDNIWRIDTESGATKLLASVDDLIDRSVDAVDLTLSPNEDFLVFRAREDDTLWSLKIPEYQKLSEEDTAAF